MASNNLVTLSISAANSGDNTILTPASNQAIHIHYMDIQNTGGSQTTVIFKDGTTAMNGLGWVIAGNGGFVFAPGVQEMSGTARKVQMKCSVGNAFVINLSGANQFSGIMIYSLENN